MNDEPDLRSQIGELLEQQLAMLRGVSGLVSADAALAIANLATAYTQFSEQPYEDD